jgi:transposase-like protein
VSRPNKGVEHVDSIEADETSKARLRAVLETIAGRLSVEAACAELGVSPTRFDQIRTAALAGAAQALSPRPAGRPPQEREGEAVLALRARVAELEHENERLRIREELALRAPGCLEPPGAKKRRPAERRPPP